MSKRPHSVRIWIVIAPVGRWNLSVPPFCSTQAVWVLLKKRLGKNQDFALFSRTYDIGDLTIRIDGRIIVSHTKVRQWERDQVVNFTRE